MITAELHILVLYGQLYGQHGFMLWIIVMLEIPSAPHAQLPD